MMIKEYQSLKRMNGNVLLTWHITSSWNSLLGDAVRAHILVRFKSLKTYQCSDPELDHLGQLGLQKLTSLWNNAAQSTSCQ